MIQLFSKSHCFACLIFIQRMLLLNKIATSNEVIQNWTNWNLHKFSILFGFLPLREEILAFHTRGPVNVHIPCKPKVLKNLNGRKDLHTNVASGKHSIPYYLQCLEYEWMNIVAKSKFHNKDVCICVFKVIYSDPEVTSPKLANNGHCLRTWSPSNLTHFEVRWLLRRRDAYWYNHLLRVIRHGESKAISCGIQVRIPLRW